MRIDSRYDLHELARRAEEARQSGASFDAFPIEMVQSVLESCVDFHPEVAEADQKGLIWGGITGAAAAGTITASALEQQLRQAENQYLRRPIVPYVLVGSLTIKSLPGLQRFKLGDTTVTLLPRMSNRYSREKIDREVERVTAIEHPYRLAEARTFIRARSHAGAFAKGMRALDYLRGLWNFRINQRTLMSYSWDTRQSVNKIVSGPVHTLHKRSGALAAQRFWYEPQEHQKEKLYDVTEEWHQFKRFTRVIRGRIGFRKYATALEDLLVRYGRALDYVEAEVAFNKLWGVLEHLTGSVGDYKHMGKKVAFLYNPSDYRYVRSTMEHLRDVRNGLVHFNEARSGIQSHLYQLKAFVEMAFRFHWSTKYRFDSIAEVSEFLSLPANSALLKERVNTYQKAVRFRS